MIVIAFLLRFIWLDRIPIGISNDELVFVSNAKAFFITRQIITHPRAELPHILASPIIGPLPSSLFNARLSYAFASVILVVLMYLMTYRLLGKESALWVGVVASFNPWSIFFGRSSYEAPIAVMFYILSFYVFLLTKSWKILFAFIPLTLAFYTYAGTKLIFIPFLILITMYSYKVINKSRYLKQYLLFALCSSLFLHSLYVFKYDAANRVSEIIPDRQAISEVSKVVDDERRLSIISSFNNFASNKFTVFSKQYIGKYLQAFSVNNLFLTGEGNQHLSLWFHGYFYYLDFILLFIGAYYLFLKNRPLSFLFVGIILISPLPSVAFSSNYSSYALRSSLMYPILIILVGLGVQYLLNLRRSKAFKILMKLGFSGIYFLLSLNFLYIYFLRFPVYNSEAFDFGSRLLSRYISLSQKTGSETLVSGSERP